MSGHLSSEELDLLELGSLDAAERSTAEGHLASCSACAQRREALVRETSHFRQYVQPKKIGELDRALNRSGMPGWLGIAALAATAAVALLVVVPALQNPKTDPWVGIRGDAVFKVIVARGEARSEVAGDAVLRAGDRLRFVVDPAGAQFALVVSRDGTGAWSVYAPFGGARSVPVGPGEQVLEGAVELDATAGREHLVAVFSDQPLAASDVIRQLTALRWPLSAGERVAIEGARSVELRSFEKR